jgi:hypothetical protein
VIQPHVYIVKLGILEVKVVAALGVPWVAWMEADMTCSMWTWSVHTLYLLPIEEEEELPSKPMSVCTMLALWGSNNLSHKWQWSEQRHGWLPQCCWMKIMCGRTIWEWDILYNHQVKGGRRTTGYYWPAGSPAGRVKLKLMLNDESWKLTPSSLYVYFHKKIIEGMKNNYCQTSWMPYYLLRVHLTKL